MAHFLRPLFSLLFICTLLSLGNISGQVIPNDARGLLDSIQHIAAKNHQPGIGIVLVKEDSVIYKGGIGIADRQNQTKVTATTNFRVGSVSKTFVALGILQLVEEGKFSLEDKISDLAPEIPFENKWSKEHPVRVAHLLEHTAGFDDMHFRNIYLAKDGPTPSLMEVMQRSKSALKSRWQPGSRHAYSNPGYTLLGYLIEKFSGQPYETFLQENVIAPLGMTNASFLLTPQVEATLSKGYKGDGETEVPYQGIYHRPAGSLHASPEALSKVLLMFLNGGKADSFPIISPASLARMEQSQTSWASEARPYGYGLGNYTMYANGYRGQGHNGGIDGFHAELSYFPEENAGYVLLFNRADLNKSAQKKIISLIHDFLLPPPKTDLPPAVKLAPDWKQSVQGHYVEANPRNQIVYFLTNLLNTLKVDFKGDTLDISGTFSPSQTRIPVSANSFRKIGEAGISTVLDKHAGGETFLQNGGQFYLKTSGGRVYTGWLGLFGFLLMIPAGIFFGLISLLFRIKGSYKGKFLPRALLGLAPVLLTSAIIATFTLNLATAGHFTFTALVIFVGLTGFGICSLAGLGSTIWLIIRDKFNWSRGFMLVLGLFYVVGTVYLAFHGLMPLRLWAY